MPRSGGGSNPCASSRSRPTPSPTSRRCSSAYARIIIKASRWSTRNSSAACARSPCRSSTATSRSSPRSISPRTRRAPRATTCANVFCPSCRPSPIASRCRSPDLCTLARLFSRACVRAAAAVAFDVRTSDNVRISNKTHGEGTMAAKTSSKSHPKARQNGRNDRAAFAGLPETIGNVRVTAPQTGAEYLASLTDGREVYIYGDRVKDVTRHPAFRNTARMVARLYDALHDPKRKERILLPTDTGNGGHTHAFFKAPKSLAETVAGRDAIAEWAKLTYGWLGRAPDYKAAFLATLGANADFYDPYQENARRWYRFSQERVPFINHAIIHPPVDRDRPPNEVGDVCVHVEKETDAGIVVSGAKVVATGSVLTNYTFIAHHGLIPVQDKKFAVVFMIPTNTPGAKFICRTSYEMTSTAMGSPFDYPLSSRIDENDAVFILDKVLVPWENVFVYGDVEKANNFFPRTGFLPRFVVHGCTRLGVKLDFIA